MQVPGLDQMPADRPGVAVDRPALPGRQLRLGLRPEFMNPRAEARIHGGDPLQREGKNAHRGQVVWLGAGGLQRSGQNLWSTSAASGDAIVGTPGAGGRGSVSTGTLETSNVDLAQQFTDVIIAQRGFQSSSRVITASDQMLQDLVNIIH